MTNSVLTVVLNASESFINCINSSWCTLPTTVLHVYFAQTMTPSIQSKSLPKTKSKRITVPETAEENGVAERYYRFVVQTARSVLIESKLPKCYWLGAVDTGAYVRELVRKDKNKSPFESFWVKNSETTHLKVVGC